ncbi:hypothetical protein DFX77_23475 [Escherichia coli]|nr:hypothetical protein [Escherichia coli]
MIQPQTKRTTGHQQGNDDHTQNAVHIPLTPASPTKTTSSSPGKEKEQPALVKMKYRRLYKGPSPAL